MIIRKQRTEAKLSPEQAGQKVSVGTTDQRDLPLCCAEKWESYGHKSLASAEKLAEIPQSEACWENSHAREGERLGARHSPLLPLSVCLSPWLPLHLLPHTERLVAWKTSWKEQKRRK